MSAPTRLGLTGGIGSGKSTVAGILQGLGAQIIDADAIARATTQSGGAALSQIKLDFGNQFIGADGALDRALMRQQIFTRPSDRTKLEAIIHPLVAQEVERQALQHASHLLVFDIPLLVESPRWCQQLDRVWVVDCCEETQFTRVERRNGWDRSTIASVMNTQCSRSRRNAAADVVIFNDQLSLSELEEVVSFFAGEFGL